MWDIAFFLLAGNDLIPILLFSQEEPQFSLLDIRDRKGNSRIL
jgi:hypothetical protein